MLGGLPHRVSRVALHVRGRGGEVLEWFTFEKFRMPINVREELKETVSNFI